MNFSAVEFDRSELSRDVSNMISVTLEDHEALYKYLCYYIAKNLVGKGANLFTHVLSTKGSDEDNEEKNIHGRVVLKLGTGEYSFRTFDGKEFYALHHYLGKPVGTDCGVQMMKRLLIFTDGSWGELGAFLNTAVEKMETTDDDKFICYTWKIRYNYWDEETKVNKRPMTSVVLPSALKNRLVTDVTKFLQPKTKDFYLRNGIPYRRSYLFYGTPGTGKTSMVQALAGHFGRNVCFLMPTHPEMTDDSLRAAVNSIPENSVVVFEDIDALFDKGRSNQIKKSSLTFSGLLNALDGIGHSNGQIFVLTTNLRENLDNALIRNGRVDLHFEFTYAIAEQMELMWSNFYPEAAARATEFSSAVIALLSAENLQVTTAALQHYFVTQMDSTVDEALSNVGLIVEEVRQNSSKSMLKDASVPAAKKDKYQNKKNKKGQAKYVADAVEEQPVAVSTEQQPQEQAGTKPAVSAAPESAAPPTEGDGAKGEEGKKKNKNKNKKNKALLKKEKKEVAESKVEVKTEAVAAAPVDGEAEAKASATTTTSASAHVAEQSVVEDGDKMAPLNKRQKKNLAYQAKKAALRKEKESTEAAEVVPVVEPEAQTN
eukprot:gene18268-13127_t